MYEFVVLPATVLTYGLDILKSVHTKPMRSQEIYLLQTLAKFTQAKGGYTLHFCAICTITLFPL